MSEPQDKELEKRSGLSVAEGPVLPFQKPKQFIHIPETVIDRVSMYMTPIIYKANSSFSNREVDVKAILSNAKNMFRDGIRHNDNLWMQHCASSIREIINFVEPEHFSEAHINIPRYPDPQVEEVINFLIGARSYLSSIVHFRPNQRVGDAEKLYPKQGYGQVDKEVFLNSEVDFFERVCIDIVYTLDHIFRTFCTNIDNKKYETT